MALSIGATACGSGAAGSNERRPPTFEGITISEFSGTTLRRRLRAAQLLVVPKRIGFLQVARLSELVLTGARLELFEEGDDPATRSAGDILFRAAHGAPEMVGAGQRLAAATIYGFECEMVRRGTLDVRVVARRGSVDPRSGNLVLDDFEVNLPPLRSVRGRRALWRAAASELVVSGAYEWRDGDSVARGRGLRLDLARPRDGAPWR